MREAVTYCSSPGHWGLIVPEFSLLVSQDVVVQLRRVCCTAGWLPGWPFADRGLVLGHCCRLRAKVLFLCTSCLFSFSVCVNDINF